MSKKILQVTTISPTLGFLTEHIKLLLKQGNSVQVACNVTNEINSYIKEQRIVINQIQFQRKLFSIKNLKSYFQIRKLYLKEKYDIVHVHTPIAAFITRFSLRKYRKNNNLRIIYTAHGFHFYKGAPIKNWIFYCTAEKIASRWSDIIITMNEEDYEFASKKLSNNGRTKIFKVGGVGVDVGKYKISPKDKNFKSILGLKDEDFVISVIAELSHRKNQMQLIKSIEKIKEDYNDIKLLIVGDGYLLEEYREYIDNNSLENNILLLGYRKDIAQILGITDVVALVSLHEGLPRNLMEAMCNKKPIVCTNIRGNIDLVKHDENGFIVEVGDVNSTCTSILKLYNSKDLSISMGEKSYEYIQKFSIDRVLKEMEIVYESII